MAIDTETYKMIRRLYTVEGLSQRQIARQLKVSRKTVRKYCAGSALPGSRKSYAVEKSSLRQAIEKKIIEIINANKDAPSKQKLNAKIIWEMLIEAGFSTGESTVRKYIRQLRNEKPEIFVPLDFEPGETMEVDWGDAYCYLNNVKTKVSVFCAVLPYSYGIFAAVFPDKTNASFFSGHVMAFEYFGGVPLTCIYDNLKSAVLKGSGKDAIKQERFKKFEAHYAYEGILCNVEAGWEKGAVENLVAIVRQIAFTPMPRVANFQELQEHVTRKCVQYCQTHKIKDRPKSIKEMLDEERRALLPLPAYPLDPAEEQKGVVYHDLTVRLNKIKYSVPPAYVGLSVTLKISPFHVEIYHEGNLIYRHNKARHQSDHQYIPEHYLEILERKPRAIKNAAPLKQGVLPPELKEFMLLCKQRDRNYQLVNILLLGRKVDKETLLWAVRQANTTGTPTYDLVCFYLEIQGKHSTPLTVDDNVKINEVDFEKYDQLLDGRHQNNEE